MNNLSTAAAHRAIDPVRADAAELARLAERLKKLQTIVDELNAKAGKVPQGST